MKIILILAHDSRKVQNNKLYAHFYHNFYSETLCNFKLSIVSAETVYQTFHLNTRCQSVINTNKKVTNTL